MHKTNHLNSKQTPYLDKLRFRKSVIITINNHTILPPSKKNDITSKSQYTKKKTPKTNEKNLNLAFGVSCK